MKSLPFLAALLFSPLSAFAGEATRVWIEYSTDLAGPWQKIDLATVPKDPAGNPVIPLDSSRGFFRTQMQIIPDGAGFTIPLTQVPEEHRKQAEAMLSDGKRGEEAWPEDCVLGPDVFPVHDKASNGGATPAFLEFKVIRGLPMPARTGFPRNFVEDCVPLNAGSLFVSLTDAESPQQESTQGGPAMTEKLWELAGRRDVKVFRFGGDFFVAEDLQGNLVANFGTQPWKPNPAFATELTAPLIWEGDTETATDTRPTVPRFDPGVYQNYPEFCTDYLMNPVYQKLRQRRALRATLERNVEHGVLPQIITLAVGEDVIILAGQTIRSRSMESDEEAEIVRIAAPGVGEPGLKITGAAPGNGILNVMHGPGTLTSFAIQVTAPGAAARSPRGGFEPGWQTVSEVVVGGKDKQVRYAQMKSSSWDGFVGCGPNAWAILLAWYEREKGLVPAFGNYIEQDAPVEYYAGGPGFAALKPVVHQLRTLCGTFDDPFSDASPTTPGEMPDGVLDYLWLPFTVDMLNYSWKGRWSGMTDDLEDGAVEVRDALKKGRCACVGLGNWWHYAVAYAYRRQEYVLTPGGPALYVRRQLRCNMGWGGGDNNWVWRNYHDTFFSMNLRLSKGANHP